MFLCACVIIVTAVQNKLIGAQRESDGFEPKWK